MPMSHRPPFRRLALALAAAQIMAYAIAPTLESRTDRATGPVALERAHTHACVVLHAPDSCLACQLLSAHGQQARAACLPLALRDAVSPAASEHASAAPRAPPRTTRSRAPPQFLA
jgi:hypothetical protein